MYAPELLAKVLEESKPTVVVLSKKAIGSHVVLLSELLRPLLGNKPLYVIPDNTIYNEYIHQHKFTRILFTRRYCLCP